MRNYDNPLTIVLTGSGASDENNTRALLEDFIFGPPENDNVDIKVIVPFSGKTSPVMNTALKILAEWGITGDDFLPVVEPDSGHRSIATASETVQVGQGEALGVALSKLGEIASTRDVAFLSFYDPENARDIDDLENAKSCEGLTTLNICEGLIDSFPGYESEAERVMREALEESFAEQEKAKADAEKPVKAPRKTAAKKAATPRKKVAAQVLTAEDEPLTEEAQSAPVAPQSGTDRLVAAAVAREAEKKAARTELSGTIVMGNAELPKDLEPAKPVAPTAPSVPDVWEDVARSVVPDTDSITVAREDLVKLNDGMKKMAEGFTEIISAYNNILEGK